MDVRKPRETLLDTEAHYHHHHCADCGTMHVLTGLAGERMLGHWTFRSSSGEVSDCKLVAVKSFALELHEHGAS